MRILDRTYTPVDTSIIHNEPMLFSASIDFAESVGGPLTRSILNKIKELEMSEILNYCNENKAWPVIDTRSHMLMKGQYPAIPGWHCDAYPRFSSGQPNLNLANPKCFHYVVTISDKENGVSNTVFANAPIEIDVDNERVWGSVHEQVEKSKINTIKSNDGEIIKFYQNTLHRAEETHTNGWRWFFRLAMYYGKPKNEIRKQVQVYTTKGGGWQ